jgi:hypothetical protein
VVLDVLARDVDIIGDLVDLVALLGAGEDAGAAQPVNRRVVGVLWIDVPVVLLDLGGNLFLPATADLLAFRRTLKPAAPARASRRACTARPSASSGTGHRGGARSASANVSL